MSILERLARRARAAVPEWADRDLDWRLRIKARLDRVERTQENLIEVLGYDVEAIRAGHAAADERE
jgi:hypothetical protein